MVIVAEFVRGKQVHHRNTHPTPCVKDRWSGTAEKVLAPLLRQQTRLALIWATFATYGSVTPLAGPLWARRGPKFMNWATNVAYRHHKLA